MTVRLAAIAASVLLLAACGSGGPDGQAQAPETPKPVRVAQAGPAPQPAGIATVGQVEADTSYVMAFKTGGVIATVGVEDGDRVTKGQTLAELDSRDVDAGFRQAQEAYETAQRNLVRTRELFQRGFAPRARLQDAEAQADAARAAAEAARATRGFARIVAPADGVVLKRHVEANAVVAAGAPVVTLSDGSQAYVLRVGLSDRDVVRIAVGDKATLRFDAWPGRTFEAEVSEIAADSDPRTGLYPAKLRVAGDGSGLKSGLVGRAAIQASGAATAGLAVPLAALLEAKGDQAFVFVVGGEAVASRRRITIGAVAGAYVEVREGLSSGETVVVDGAGFLADGAKVAIATADAR